MPCSAYSSNNFLACVSYIRAFLWKGATLFCQDGHDYCHSYSSAVGSRTSGTSLAGDVGPVQWSVFDCYSNTKLLWGVMVRTCKIHGGDGLLQSTEKCDIFHPGNPSRGMLHSHFSSSFCLLGSYHFQFPACCRRNHCPIHSKSPFLDYV